MGSTRSGNQRLEDYLARPSTWVRAVIFTATMMAVVAAHPVERLLGWQYDRSNLFSPVASWPDTLAWLLVAMAGQTVWLRVFRKEQSRIDRERLRADLLEGRILRMPFAARIGGLLASIVLAFGGMLLRQTGHVIEPAIFWTVWAGFLFFVLQETAFVLVPGEALVPEPDDELLAFLRGRVLKVGFATVVLSLCTISLLAIVLPIAVATVMPICLLASVFLPACLLRRLEYEADAAP